MNKIFCLMGKSSTGKDTIFKILKDDKELNLKPIIPYTTRPKRVNETNGVDYHFITEEQFKAFDEEGKIIEKRSYNTVKGIWHYCTVDDGQINLEENNHIIIATPEAYKGICSYFGSLNVVPIYITIDDGTRLQRALDREKQQKNPNYEELCRRFLADNRDFSDEMLKEYNIEKHYENHDLDKCIDTIKRDVLKVISSP